MWFSRILLACALVTSGAVWADTFKLVTFEYPPYEYTENGEVKGMAVEIVREAFKLMNHEVSIEVLPWTRCQVMFERGEVDGIFTFFQNEERQVFTLFSKEIVVNQTIALWVLKDTKIEFNGDLTKLQSYNFGITPKTSYGERFDTAIKYGLLRTEAAASIESNIRKLVNGRVDIWVSNRDGAIHELKRLGLSGLVRELKHPIQVVPAFVGFSRLRNHIALRDSFDQALATLKHSGAYDTIVRKYGQ
ncbi:MAG: transporter substrate-binding domain-containing protein [Pseudomonadota bacterium]